MRNRCRALAAVFAVSLAPVLVACQAPSSTASRAVADTGSSLSTPWGEPDLQGIWTDTTETPLERPTQFAGKEVLHG